MALNPGCCASSWFSYYEELLRPTLLKYCESKKVDGLSYGQALRNLSHRFAILELCPYYSANSSQIHRKLFENLPSVRKAKKAAEDLRRRALNKKATVIVRWSPKWFGWGSENNEITQMSGRNGFKAGETAILKRLAEDSRKPRGSTWGVASLASVSRPCASHSLVMGGSCRRRAPTNRILLL